MDVVYSVKETDETPTNEVRQHESWTYDPAGGQFYGTQQ